MKTPISYYGGKQQLASKIVSLFPEHKIYCEPFTGGAAVFFAKPQAQAEIINDINSEVSISTKCSSMTFPHCSQKSQSAFTAGNSISTLG